MILLETHNRILDEVIRQRFESSRTKEKKEAIDITIADFDGVTYHVSTNAAARNLITVSISWSAIPDIRPLGMTERLATIYGSLVTETEVGYDFSIQFDLDNPPASIDDLAKKVSLMKRNIFAIPFLAVAEGKQKDLVTLNYRSNEAMYIKPEADSVTVIFSINFKDQDDVVIGKVFLQEFQDCRRSMNAAPAVSFSHKTSPLELKGVPGVYEGNDQGFVSFVLFKNHLDPARREKSIDTIQLFRDYLHYHIKCSKAYMHTRMRLRVEALLQVLNRAKMKNANQDEKKTASGKSFKRDGN